jgi:hypothetical protein
MLPHFLGVFGEFSAFFLSFHAFFTAFSLYVSFNSASFATELREVDVVKALLYSQT